MSRLSKCDLDRLQFSPSLMPLLVLRLIRADMTMHVTPLLNDLHWLRAPERITYNILLSGVQLSPWHGAAVSTRCHSACCWSNVAPSTAVCFVVHSCAASNTSFITWRQSLCDC